MTCEAFQHLNLSLDFLENFQKIISELKYIPDTLILIE